MTSLFASETPLPDVPTGETPETSAAEYEFVLGRRQIASVSLVALTALAGFTTAAYMAGRGAVPVAVPTRAQAPVTEPDPVAAAPAAPTQAIEAPVFGIPEKDHRYLQLGSVERGFAVLMVQGSRKVGFPAIVAGGTNPNVFRVLVGPLDDKMQYAAAKAMFGSMGLDTYARKYGESPEPIETPEP